MKAEGKVRDINGWVFLVLGISLASFLPVVARQSWLSMLVIAAFAAAVLLLAVLNLQPAAAQQARGWLMVGSAAGWIIGLAGLVMVYQGIALSLQYGLGKPALPFAGPLGGGASGPPPAQQA